MCIYKYMSLHQTVTLGRSGHCRQRREFFANLIRDFSTGRGLHLSGFLLFAGHSGGELRETRSGSSQ